MHRPMKDDSSCRASRTDENTSLEQSNENLHVKLGSGSCHTEQILQTLDANRQNGALTDVVLALNGREFPCHRATLSANSTYFRAMFARGLKDSGQDTISLPEVSAHSMSLALEDMYGGHATIQEDNVEGLLELSSLRQIPKLQDACVLFLEGQLHPGNCLRVMRFAENFSIASLAEKSKRVMAEGFVEVAHHEEFLDLEAAELGACLVSEQLVVSKEEAVFEAVMRWVRHHGATRRGALKDLLAHVRLPLLDPVYFLEKVETDQLIQGCKDCLPLLQEARRYHILGTEVSSVRCRPRRSMELAEAIVVIGGCDRKGLLKLPFVDALHPESKQWKPLPNVPGCAKSEFAACTLKNDIYISGGHVASREVWMLSSQLNVWIRVARLQKGRWRHKMASLQGKIYAVGGYDGVYRLSSVECYDPFSNSWAAVAPLLEAVSSPAVASCLHKLYVIGGATEDGANTEKVQCYDPQGNTWSLLSPAPFCQRCINAVTLDHVIYVAGGLLSAVFSYDPRSDAWREAALLPGPLESCGVTVCSGKIHILGGQDENGEGSDKAFALDVAAGVMEPQPPLQRCTSYHGCVTILRSTCR